MPPKPPKNVAEVFADCPTDVRRTLTKIRTLIFKTAALSGAGPLTETLKWGQPAYLTEATHSGTTIRLGWHADKPGQVAVYVHCQTSLVETYRAMFPNDFEFEGNRALWLSTKGDMPTDALAVCLEAALNYHRDKKTRTRQSA